MHLPDSYNVPLHQVVEHPELIGRMSAAPIVHLHYHWLFSPEHHLHGLAALERLGVPADRLAWLRARLPLESAGVNARQEAMTHAL